MLPWLVAAACLVLLMATRVLDAPEPVRPTAAVPNEITARIEGLERDLADLREEVRGLRVAPGSSPARAPTGIAERPTPSGPTATRPTATASSTRAAAKSDAPPPRFGPLTLRQAGVLSRSWGERIRALDNAPARARAIGEILAALESEDDATLLAGLWASRRYRPDDYDPAEWRRLILPHASSDDPLLRRAALDALLIVMPDRADLALWIQAAHTADRSNAEQTARALVLLSEGRVEAEVADAVLHLLRPGTDIKAAFVIRGLNDATVIDSRVEARLIEIVRSVDPRDYDSGYFFHFLAPDWDPKSDALVDLILERAAKGQGSLDTILRGLKKGLDERQRERAAERLIVLAENAGTERARAHVLEGMAYVAGPAQVDRLRAIASDPEVDKRSRGLAKTAISAAAKR
jgi:hypothetical protein